MHARPGPSQAAPFIIFGKQKAAGSWADLKKPLVIFHKVEGNPCHYEGATLPASRTRVSDEVPTRLTTVAPTALPPAPCAARGVVRRKLVFKARPKPITRTAAIRKRIRLDGPEAPGGQEPEAPAAPLVPEVPGASS